MRNMAGAGMLLLCASTASAQALWSWPAPGDQDVVTEEVAFHFGAYATYFEIENPSYDDGWGEAAALQLYSWRPWVAEVGFFFLDSEMEHDDDRDFDLGIVVIGGGWGLGGSGAMSMTLTGGFVVFNSHAFDSERSTKQGGYVALTAHYPLSRFACAVLRITGMGNEHNARIGDEGIDWITAWSVGIEAGF